MGIMFAFDHEDKMEYFLSFFSSNNKRNGIGIKQIIEFTYLLYKGFKLT